MAVKNTERESKQNHIRWPYSGEAPIGNAWTREESSLGLESLLCQSHLYNIISKIGILIPILGKLKVIGFVEHSAVLGT